jgi:hypothetical protein
MQQVLLLLLLLLPSSRPVAHRLTSGSCLGSFTSQPVSCTPNSSNTT